MRTPQPENDSGARSVRATCRACSGLGDAGEEALPGVGGPHPAGPLVAVQGQGVGGQLLAPECLLEPLAQRLGLLRQLRGPVRPPQHGSQRRAGPPGGVDVALHLAQSDGAMRQRAVGVEDGVVGVLPPLVQQAIGRLPLILHEAVPVPVAVAVDPVQGGLDVGPQGVDEGPVAGALVVGASEQDEQRRGIDAAVVAAEGNLLQRRHLAAAGLVQDLAGLGVLLGDRPPSPGWRPDTPARPGPGRAAATGTPGR